MTEHIIFFLENDLRGGCFFFLLGLIFGSFANVLIFRLPREINFVKIRSFCDHCRTPLRWFENIPLFSWILLRGRCSSCGKSISFRLFFVELIMGVLFSGLFLHFGFKWFFLESCVFVFGLLVVSMIDFDFMFLPDSFTLSGIVLGLFGAFFNPERAFLDALIGGLLGGGILWGVAFFYQMIRKKEGLGGGDIKLLAWIGTVLGSKSIFFVIMVSGFVGCLVGLLTMFRTKEEFQTLAIPFGPYLSLGGVLYLFYGPFMINWYFKFLLSPPLS